MRMTPELLEAWEGIDEDVRQEVIGVIKASRDASKMNDDDHPKNQQYSDAFAVVVGVLES